ncbi:hypothetical protein HYV86_01735 [Candidatus Woesearchaeota archaeon]|nr:hypothetical protein [Candidatus Woesearchaeota archaeon]
MNQELREAYRKELRKIEPPVRGIVAALWDCDFVVDSQEVCSGHIVTPNYLASLGGVEPVRQGLYWYPHGVRLYLYLRADDSRSSEFSSAVSSIENSLHTSTNSYRGKYTIHTGETVPAIHFGLHSDLPSPESLPEATSPLSQKEEYIANTEAQLRDYWNKFAGVLRNFNPHVPEKIDENASFRTIIDWATWSTQINGKQRYKEWGRFKMERD